MKRFEKHIFGAACAMWCAYIYGFSADVGAVSGGKSRIIAEFCERIFRFLTSWFLKYDANSFRIAISYIMRKCAHMAEFAVLAALLSVFVRAVCGRIRKYIPFVFTVMYAAADEFHQAFVPGRGPAVTDVLIDSIGAAIGTAIIFVYLKKLRKAMGDVPNDI